MAGAPPLALSAAELEAVSRHVYGATGMRFGPAKGYYVERRMAERMVAAGVAEVGAYLRRLGEDPAEAQALVNSLTVNETYFYREPHQLACLSRSLLPEVVRGRAPGDKVRLWSAPCATGEEAYSLAIWLLDNWRMVDAYNVEIIGSDIDTRALAAARAGVYGARALERLPRTAVEAYFEPAGPSGRRLIQDLRESVRFGTANLVDPASVAAQGRFDVIFCRNVLIYFDEDSRRRALGLLAARLNPGGFLCLGHAETLAAPPAGLQSRRFPDATVLQRGAG